LTKLQKRIYVLILRALVVLIFWRAHAPDKEVASESDKLRGDMTKAILELEKSLKK
jgi:hypothetical protein